MILLTIAALCSSICYVQGVAKIDRIAMCDPAKDYLITITSKIVTEGDKQIVEEGSMNAKVDIDRNTLESVEVLLKNNDKWDTIIKREDSFCNIRDKFMGEFATELEKAAGIPEGCSFKKGEYKVSNHILDFSKFKHKDFPEGTLMIRSQLKDPNTKDVFGCIEIEFTLKK